MRWPIKQKPVDGRWRMCNKFAWLPTRVSSYVVLWFRSYTVYERYRASTDEWIPRACYWDWSPVHRNWREVSDAFWRLYVAVGNVMLNRHI